MPQGLFLYTYLYAHVRVHPTGQITRSKGICILNCNQYCQIALPRGHTNFQSHQQCVRGPDPPPSSPTRLVIKTLTFASPWVKKTWQHLITDLICFSYEWGWEAFFCVSKSWVLPLLQTGCSCSLPIFRLVFFLLICSITLQMKRIRLLSYLFAKYVFYTDHFLAANCLCTSTDSPQAARVVFPKCHSDGVTLLPKDTKQLPATWIQLKLPTWFGGPAHLGPSFLPAPTKGPPHAAVRVVHCAGGSDTQGRTLGAPPGGEQRSSPPRGCLFLWWTWAQDSAHFRPFLKAPSLPFLQGYVQALPSTPDALPPLWPGKLPPLQSWPHFRRLSWVPPPQPLCVPLTHCKVILPLGEGCVHSLLDPTPGQRRCSGNVCGMNKWGNEWRQPSYIF